MTRVSTSSEVQSVSNASASSAQNRSRCVRTYQLVRTSRCSRTRLARRRDVVGIQLLRGARHQVPRARQDVAVHRRERGRACGVDRLRDVAGSSVRGTRVQREEVVRAPQRQQHLAHAVADALLADDEVAPAQDRARHEEPAHGVRAVHVPHLRRVGEVPQRLAGLAAVVAQHDAVAQDVAERRAVEQRRGQHVQRVEPAAGLADVLDDEVARVVVLEPVRVLERVVHLRERHRAAVEPHVEDVRDAAHRALHRTGRPGSGASARR